MVNVPVAAVVVEPGVAAGIAQNQIGRAAVGRSCMTNIRLEPRCYGRRQPHTQRKHTRIEPEQGARTGSLDTTLVHRTTAPQ